MKSLKMFAALAICIGIAGCDTTAFTEDFPDPGTEGLPPYVAFDIAQLNTPGASTGATASWAYTAANDAAGSVRTIATPAAPVNVFGLRPRLPVAIGEDVTVTFATSGSAVRGTDYRIEQFDVDAAGCVSPYDMAACWVVVTGNSVVIKYFDENPDAARQAPNFRDLRIVVLPRPAGTAARTVVVDLTGASAPSGREIVIGRFPDNRDNRATLNIQAVPVP
jgi:hypothetical protein